MDLIKLIKAAMKYYAVHDNYCRLTEPHRKHEEANLARAKEKADEAVIEFFSNFIGSDVKSTVSNGIDMKEIRQEITNQVSKMEAHLKENAVDMNKVSTAINNAVERLANKFEKRITALVDEITKPSPQPKKQKNKNDLI